MSIIELVSLTDYIGDSREYRETCLSASWKDLVLQFRESQRDTLSEIRMDEIGQRVWTGIKSFGRSRRCRSVPGVSSLLTFG